MRKGQAMAGLGDILGGILGGGGDGAQGQSGGGLGDVLGSVLGGGGDATSGSGQPDLGAILGNLTGGEGGGMDLSKLMALAGPLLAMLQSGGLGDLLGKLTGGGLGEQAASWTGTGANEAVDPGSLAAAVGPDTVQSLASQSGLSVEDTEQGLSTLLPGLVDKLSPDGALPASGDLDSVLGQLGGLFGRS